MERDELLALPDIVRKHVEAVGGAEALSAVQSVRFKFRIVENDYQLSGVYLADRAGRMRVDVFDGAERVYTEGFDGRHAWALKKGHTVGEIEGPQAAAALRHGLEIPGKVYWLHEIEGRGSKIRLGKNQRVDNIDYYVLKITLPDGFHLDLYLNTGTFLVERSRDHRALHPDVNRETIPIETRYTDLRKIDGITRHFREQQIDLKTKKVLSTTEIDSVEINIPIDETAFSIPTG